MQTAPSSSAHVDVSVTIPAWNEGGRLPTFLAQIAATALQVRAPVMEVIVSDDGSRNDSAEAEGAAVEAAQERMVAARAPHRFRFVRAEQNAGKGAAIRRGWAHAAPEARWLGFVDADGAISAGELFRTAGMLDELGADLVAGSRVKMAGRTIERKLFRHVQGRVFATLVEQMFALGFYDTQCGLKYCRAELLRPLIPRLQEQHWLLDIELLAHMKQAGARMVEVPIDWVDNADSRVRFGIDAVRMLAGLRRIKSRL
ncbi:MAG: glycosyltransferase [Myxococcaceae bacterium]|nr:glycosyltransferase [Myxococcaceae bacterium]